MATKTLDIKISRKEKSKLSELDFDNIVFGTVYSDHMFVADYEDGEWKNLEIRPYEKLSIAPGMAAIHYGQSIFEGLKAYKTAEGKVQIFRPDANIKRLNLSAKRMCIPELPEEIYTQGLVKLLELDKDWVSAKAGSSLYIRPFIFATDEYLGIRPSNTYKFIIFTCPVTAYYTEPVRVKIETEYSRASQGGTGFAKAAGNYAGSLYPAKLALEQGYDQLIWTDAATHTLVEESGTMNLIFVIDGKLRTAEAGETILDGITRSSVIQLAKDWGMEVVIGELKITDIITAIEEGRLQEAFGTGTAVTIAQIKCIGHEGVDYDLPTITESNFSSKVSKALDDIKYGRVTSPHQWIETV